MQGTLIHVRYVITLTYSEKFIEDGPNSNLVFAGVNRELVHMQWCHIIMSMLL